VDLHGDGRHAEKYGSSAVKLLGIKRTKMEDVM
jgi:hypothetical protein